VRVVEWQQWWREEEGNVEAAVEETYSSGVDDGGVESGGDLESFGMKNKMTRGMLLFIGPKISTSVADSFGIRIKAVLL
jgi:hypothetical protein